MESKLGKWWVKLKLFDILLLILMGLGLLLLAWGGLSLFTKDQVEVEYITDEETAGGIFVDVQGAVIKPGVYEFNKGARLKDALIMAGGLAAEADREYVAKMVNLAEKVEDGMKIYIPREGGRGSTPNELGASVDQIGLVNINTAGVAELDGLWGVGQARVEAIVAGRPYKKVEDLVEKGVLPKNVFERNKDKLTVY
ncbi:helix-hairpin-helix domain-containing protein [Candidatus Collierbacteria bacterium]|nr:helix-hairpin-helix domain-containing protein [Candidatus Collierbacteria bacterium]